MGRNTRPRIALHVVHALRPRRKGGVGKAAIFVIPPKGGIQFAKANLRNYADDSAPLGRGTRRVEGVNKRPPRLSATPPSITHETQMCFVGPDGGELTHHASSRGIAPHEHLV